MPGDERRRWFWIAPAIPIALSAAAGLAAGAIVFATTSQDLRLAPTPAGWLFFTSFAAPVVGGVCGLTWLLVRWRRARPGGRVRSRVLIAVALALAILGAAAGGLALALNRTLFQSTPVADSVSPGGARAYVCRWSFICGHELWLQEPGDLMMRRLESVGTTCEARPTIEWDDQKPRMVGATPSSFSGFHRH